MAGAKATLASPQRVLVTMEESMKEEAAEVFAAQGMSFSEGVRQCIAARLASSSSDVLSVDAETKQEAERVLGDMGLDVESAVSVFLKEVVRRECIPFAVQSGRGSCTYALVPFGPALEESEPQDGAVSKLVM